MRLTHAPGHLDTLSTLDYHRGHFAAVQEVAAADVDAHFASDAVDNLLPLRLDHIET